RAVQGLNPTLMKRADQIRLVGKQGDALGNALGERLSPIHFQVPLARADARQEILALGVIGDEFPVETMRVPADQHIADIENRNDTVDAHMSFLSMSDDSGRRAYPLCPRQ